MSWIFNSLTTLITLLSLFADHLCLCLIAHNKFTFFFSLTTNLNPLSLSLSPLFLCGRVYLTSNLPVVGTDDLLPPPATHDLENVSWPSASWIISEFIIMMTIIVIDKRTLGETYREFDVDWWFIFSNNPDFDWYIINAEVWLFFLLDLTCWLCTCFTYDWIHLV